MTAGPSAFERLPLCRGREWIGYGVAGAATLAALALRLAIDPIVPPGFPFITFFPVVILVCFLFGARPAVLAAVLTGLLARWYFIAPAGTLALAIPQAMAVGFYVLIAATLIFCIDTAHKASRRAVHARTVIAGLAETRALLFHELQHRTSNNLQVIAALLAAQRRQVTDPAARLALETAANRLAVVGRISREMYRPDGGPTPMRDFLATLSRAVLETSGREDIRCTFAIDDGLTVSADHAVPLALVFTEALSNALEHGLPDRAGTVAVQLARTADGKIELSVRDDGSGLPPSFDLEAGQSLGLKIARQLSTQLGGSFDLRPGSNGRGTEARLLIAV